jgi:putative transposase
VTQSTYTEDLTASAPALTTPLSADAAEYAKQVAVRSNPHVDPAQAVQDLLADWAGGPVLTRRSPALARRISAQTRPRR